MVQPTTLKKRHSLKNCKLLPVVKRIRQGRPDTLKEYARVNKDLKTENLSMDDIGKWAKDITGEDMTELLDLAGRDINVEEARWALHSLIVYANEVGQPKGQDLQQANGPEEGSGSSTVARGIGDSGAGKRKRAEEDELDNNLEDRIKTLEKAAKVEMVQELRGKVRTLCLQQEPSGPLILLTLEELARTARRVCHEDADTFEELARQANRHQAKLDISTLCLSVLGGKAADTISKAISKCLKDKDSKNEPKGTGDVNQKREDSPLASLYPPYQAPMMYPMFPGAYPGMQNFGTMGGGYSGSGYRNTRLNSYRQNPRPRGACLFCESHSHQVKDCDKMKAAKGK